MRLMVVFGSVRQERKGEVVANWINRTVEQDERFELDYVDLKELDLPFFNEPMDPFEIKDKNASYVNPNGQVWAARVGKADAFILITPEYNYSPSAVLKNSLDWVGYEWADKPVSLVGYGGAAGGARAVEQLRQVVGTLGLIQTANDMPIVSFGHAFDEKGEPKEERYKSRLKWMLDESERLHNIFHK